MYSVIVAFSYLLGRDDVLCFMCCVIIASGHTYGGVLVFCHVFGIVLCEVVCEVSFSCWVMYIMLLLC